MRDSAVVLGIEEPRLQNEVLDYLERLPHVRVVASTSDASGLARQVRRSDVDAAVVTPSSLGADLDGTPVLVVASRETTEDLRRAVRAGARGFYLWPEEREALARDAEMARRRSSDGGHEGGSLVAVCGAKGGTGTTFVATNLAAAMADLGGEPLLLDVDTDAGDLAGALGLDEGALPVIDAVTSATDLHPEEIARVADEYPRGFRLLGVRATEADAPNSAVSAIRRIAPAVLTHVPRTLAASAFVAEADRILVVVTLDVPSIRAARRLLDALEVRGARNRCRLVVNRASRGEIVPADAEDALGAPVLGLIPNDRAAERSQNRGELIPRGAGRMGRAFARLARSVTEEIS